MPEVVAVDIDAGTVQLTGEGDSQSNSSDGSNEVEASDIPLMPADDVESLYMEMKKIQIHFELECCGRYREIGIAI